MIEQNKSLDWKTATLCINGVPIKPPVEDACYNISAEEQWLTCCKCSAPVLVEWTGPTYCAFCGDMTAWATIKDKSAE